MSKYTLSNIQFRPVRISTAPIPQCKIHWIFMDFIMVDKGDYLNQEYECRICANTLTREVLIEKYVKWQHIKKIAKKALK